MRKQLLASAAVAALAFGGSMASAQTSRPEEKSTSQAKPAAQMEMKGDAGDKARGTPTERGGAMDRSSGESQRSQAQPARQPGAVDSEQGQKSSAQGEKQSGEQRKKSAAEPMKGGATSTQSNDNDRSGQGAQRPGSATSETHGKTGDRAGEDRKTGAGGAAAQRSGEKSGEGGGASERRSTSQESGQQGRAPGEQTTTGAQTTGPSGAREGSGNQAETDSGRNNGPRLDAQQQTRMRDAIARERVESTRADFDVNVGVRVPGHVRFHPLPRDIVEIVPQYRGYDYVMVNDEIVIVEPRTRKIVTVVGREGVGGGGRAANLHRLNIPMSKQKVVYRDVIRDARPIDRAMEVTVGQRVPQDVELAPLPQMVFSEVPDVRDYRYFVINREVVLVDPDTREVVEIIRE